MKNKKKIKDPVYTGLGILERSKRTVIIPIREVTIEEILKVSKKLNYG